MTLTQALTIMRDQLDNALGILPANATPLRTREPREIKADVRDFCVLSVSTDAAPIMGGSGTRNTLECFYADFVTMDTTLDVQVERARKIGNRLVKLARGDYWSDNTSNPLLSLPDGSERPAVTLEPMALAQNGGVIRILALFDLTLDIPD